MKRIASLGIADAAARRRGQLAELGEPAGDRRPLAEARRAMHEAHAFAGHRIFIAAAEVEGRCGDRRIDRRLDRHEGVIAVDRRPTGRPAGRARQARQPRRTVRPLLNSTWLTRIRSMLAGPRRARGSGPKNRRTARRRPWSARSRQSSAQRAICRRAEWNSPSLISTRSGPPAAARAGGGQADQEVVGVGREDDRRRIAAAELGRRHGPAPRARPRPSPCPTYGRPARAASSQHSTWPSKEASGQR